MTLHRYAKARDANEPEVIEWLETHGYSVERIDVPCDLIVGKARRSHLVEVKMPKEKLTPAQMRFQRRHRGDYHIVRSGEDAVAQLDKCAEVIR